MRERTATRRLLEQLNHVLPNGIVLCNETSRLDYVDTTLNTKRLMISVSSLSNGYLSRPFQCLECNDLVECNVHSDQKHVRKYDEDAESQVFLTNVDNSYSISGSAH